MDQLIASCRSVVIRAAAKHQRRGRVVGMDTDDLIQAGYLGAIDAAKRYTAGSGTSFVTFATRRIEGEIVDAIRLADPLSRKIRRRESIAEGADDAAYKATGTRRKTTRYGTTVSLDDESLRLGHSLLSGVAMPDRKPAEDDFVSVALKGESRLVRAAVRLGMEGVVGKERGRSLGVCESLVSKELQQLRERRGAAILRLCASES